MPAAEQQKNMAKDSAPVATPVEEYEEDIFLHEEPEVAATDVEDVASSIKGEDVLLEEIHTLATSAAVDNTEFTTDNQDQEPEAPATQAVPNVQLEQAKAGMAWSTETMLTQTPEMANALQLNKVGDAVTISVSTNGVTYEVTWKVAAIERSAPEPVTRKPSITAAPVIAANSALRDASPLSGGVPKATSSSGVKCKFGRACTKGAACPYDHTIKAKLCSYVNTAQGCSSGANCEFSHDNEGMKCTRSATRYMCPNGRGCAFKHGDDWAKPVKKVELAKKVAPVQQAESVKTIEPEVKEEEDVVATPPVNAPTGPKAERASDGERTPIEITPDEKGKQDSVSPTTEGAPTGAPTGPKNTSIPQAAGQKRAREGDEEHETAEQRPRLAHDNNARGFGGRRPPRGRGRGVGQGGGRGGGRGRGGMGLNIRGAATRGGR